MKITSDFDLDIFQPLMEIHPYDQIINSVIIGRVRDFKPTTNAKAIKNGEATMDGESNMSTDENINGDGIFDCHLEDIGERRKSNLNGDVQSEKARRQMTRQR